MYYYISGKFETFAWKFDAFAQVAEVIKLSVVRCINEARCPLTGSYLTCVPCTEDNYPVCPIFYQTPRVFKVNNQQKRCLSTFSGWFPISSSQAFKLDINKVERRGFSKKKIDLRAERQNLETENRKSRRGGRERIVRSINIYRETSCYPNDTAAQSMQSAAGKGTGEKGDQEFPSSVRFVP